MYNNNISLTYNVDAGKSNRIARSFEQGSNKNKVCIGTRSTGDSNYSRKMERAACRRARDTRVSRWGAIVCTAYVNCTCTGYMLHAHVVWPRWRKWKISLVERQHALHTYARLEMWGAGSCTCTDTLLDLARLPVSRGIGEYQLPDLVVNPASRIIFGSVSRVRICFPRADLSYQSYPLSARLRLRGHEQLNTGARFPFVGNISRFDESNRYI